MVCSNDCLYMLHNVSPHVEPPQHGPQFSQLHRQHTIVPITKYVLPATACAGPELPLEAFNRYALLLDIDGNAWSDRYRLLVHFNTPVLKQASNLTAFFEHVMAPGVAMEQYAVDLSDLPTRARELLGEMQSQPGRLIRMAGEEIVRSAQGAGS